MISDWKEAFKNECIKMKKKSLTTVNLPNRGSVRWYPDKKCEKCNKFGVFSGWDLECGKFYECATADYCPSCEKVNVFYTNVNFATYNQKRFLPIMKKKILENPRFIEKLKKTDPCPECRGQCYKYEKDLGGIDYYDNIWVVCINPDCNWPGEHSEKFESGPY